MLQNQSSQIVRYWNMKEKMLQIYSLNRLIKTPWFIITIYQEKEMLFQLFGCLLYLVNQISSKLFKSMNLLKQQNIDLIATFYKSLFLVISLWVFHAQFYLYFNRKSITSNWRSNLRLCCNLKDIKLRTDYTRERGH